MASDRDLTAGQGCVLAVLIGGVLWGFVLWLM